MSFSVEFFTSLSLFIPHDLPAQISDSRIRACNPRTLIVGAVIFPFLNISGTTEEVRSVFRMTSVQTHFDLHLIHLSLGFNRTPPSHLGQSQGNKISASTPPCFQ